MGLALAERETAQLELDLTAEEQTEFERCEETLRLVGQAVFDGAEALETIRDKRLYRATHSNFDTYCEERVGISGSQAHDLIKARQILQNVQDSGHLLPILRNPAQALALRNVPEAEQGNVLQTAVETAPNGALTASHIKKTADEHLGKTVPEPPQQEEPKPATPTLERPDASNLLRPMSPTETGESAEKLSDEEETSPTPALTVVDNRSAAATPTAPTQTTTPKAAAPTKSAETAPASSNFVQHMIPRDEDDWLWENELTAATAIAALREVRVQLANANMALSRPQLTPKAEKALMALVEFRNSKPETEPVTAIELLETILVVRCDQAGITIDESEETSDE
jgi:hypothetical protein